MRTTLLLVLALAAAPLAAQETILFPRFTIAAGSYQTNFETDIRVDDLTTAASGTAITAEDELALEPEQITTRLALTWRPFRRHEFALSHHRTSRSATTVIDREIVFEDESYPVNAQVSSELSTESIDLAYTWWLLQRDRSGAGLVLGLSQLSLDALIEAESNGQSLAVSNEASTEVPVATIGAQGRVLIGSRVTAGVVATILPRVTIDAYSGRALNGRAQAELRIAGPLAAGIAWNIFRLDGTVEHLDFAGDLAMTMQGAEAYVRLAF